VDRVRRIADAVLYEGYMLWPYRRSALKNQRRWTFGGVYPHRHTATHPDDPCVMQTQCLARADPDARLEVQVRFLHVIQRSITRLTATGREPVEEMVVGDERYVPWEEATEREVGTELRRGAPERVEIRIPAGEEEEFLHDDARQAVGVVTHSWSALAGWVEASCEQRDAELLRITVRISNESWSDGEDRQQALKTTFCSTHTVLRIEGGELVSLTDPPAALRAEAERCSNIGTWPVLAGEPGERHTVLSSPIILPDHPEIAPESPGDLFDAGEIDQLLTLGILTLTDEEKQQMREADPRTREILTRTESLSQEELMKLHGTIREFGMTR
jgi:hypothetical protein